MSEVIEGVWLSPKTEAKRLWDGALGAFFRVSEGIIQLSEAIKLGTRVVEILTVQCLQPVRDRYPATIADLLQSPPPDVNPERDFLHAPQWLRYVDALDLLSAEHLSCISPLIHPAWEDRVASCQRARARTREVTFISLDEEKRKNLMLIGAYRNRIFRLPPPVWIIPDEIKGAFPTLIELVEDLFTSARIAARGAHVRSSICRAASVETALA